MYQLYSTVHVAINIELTFRLIRRFEMIELIVFIDGFQRIWYHCHFEIDQSIIIFRLNSNALEICIAMQIDDGCGWVRYGMRYGASGIGTKTYLNMAHSYFVGIQY